MVRAQKPSSQTGRRSNRSVSSNRSDSPTPNAGDSCDLEPHPRSPQRPSVWESVLLRLKNYWTKSATTLSRNHSSNSSTSSAYEPPRGRVTPPASLPKTASRGRGKRPTLASTNTASQKMIRMVTEALMHGTSHDYVIRNGRHFAVSVEAHPYETDAGPRPHTSSAMSEPMDEEQPRPLSIEKAKTLKIDKVFNNRQTTRATPPQEPSPPPSPPRNTATRCLKCRRMLPKPQQQPPNDDETE